MDFRLNWKSFKNYQKKKKLEIISDILHGRLLNENILYLDHVGKAMAMQEL